MCHEELPVFGRMITCGRGNRCTGLHAARCRNKAGQLVLVEWDELGPMAHTEAAGILDGAGLDQELHQAEAYSVGSEPPELPPAGWVGDWPPTEFLAMPWDGEL